MLLRNTALPTDLCTQCFLWLLERNTCLGQITKNAWSYKRLRGKFHIFYSQKWQAWQWEFSSICLFNFFKLSCLFQSGWPMTCYNSNCRVHWYAENMQLHCSLSSHNTAYRAVILPSHWRALARQLHNQNSTTSIFSRLTIWRCEISLTEMFQREFQALQFKPASLFHEPIRLVILLREF